MACTSTMGAGRIAAIRRAGRESISIGGPPVSGLQVQASGVRGYQMGDVPPPAETLHVDAHAVGEMSCAAGKRHAAGLPYPASITDRVVWTYAAPLTMVHALALLVLWPWLFTWSGVVLLVAGIYFYGGIGIDLCYHRLLTHRSFSTPLWLERMMVIVAVCCLEDTPGSWVATHRLHHNESDKREDPHSPLVSFFWGHLNWLFFENRSVRNGSAYDRFARDILRDPFYLRLERSMLLALWIYAAHAGVYVLAGVAVGWAGSGSWVAGVQLGLSWLVWGVFLPHGVRVAYQLDGQFPFAPVWLPELRHAGQQPEQLAGLAADQRRGLAQQPPPRSVERLECAPLV